MSPEASDASAEVAGRSAGGAAPGAPTLRFLIPSVLGLLVFFCPIRYAGRVTVPLDAMTHGLGGLLGAGTVPIVCVICIVSGLAALLTQVRYRGDTAPAVGLAGLLASVFHAPPLWSALRLVGAIASAAWLLRRGPAWLLAPDVTPMALESVGAVVFLIYVVSAITLPLITDYGLMEFFGVLTRPAFQAVFRLPGRASLDALASWVSSGPVAILITLRQYDAGYYTAREATFIATTFHIVSLPFTLVIAEVTGISPYYFSWYATLVVVGFLTALLVRLLPPWTWQPSTYVGGEHLSAVAHTDLSRHEAGLEGSVLRRAVEAGIAAAAKGPGLREYARDGLENLFRTVFGLIGTCIGVVVLANLLLEYTPAFRWLSAPLVPVVGALGLAEPERSAPALLIGFLDQFLTATVAQPIHDLRTRFVLASLSVSQVIYLSNIGVMLMRSSLAIRFRDLALMFAVRTVIATPCFVLAAHCIV